MTRNCQIRRVRLGHNGKDFVASADYKHPGRKQMSKAAAATAVALYVAEVPDQASTISPCGTVTSTLLHLQCGRATESVASPGLLFGVQ